MSDPASVSGGNPPAAPVAPHEEPIAPKKDTVAYETHAKLLSEKKKLQEAFEAAQKALRDRDEAELREKEDFKKIAELREAEANQYKQELDTVRARERNAIKLETFLDSLQGNVDKRFWGHIPLDQIVLDPTSGEPDPSSVNKAVEWFRKEYFDIIKKPGQQTLPNTAPQGSAGAGTISRAEWLKLDHKEMVKWRPGQITD